MRAMFELVRYASGHLVVVDSNAPNRVADDPFKALMNNL